VVKAPHPNRGNLQTTTPQHHNTMPRSGSGAHPQKGTHTRANERCHREQAASFREGLFDVLASLKHVALHQQQLPCVISVRKAWCPLHHPFTVLWLPRIANSATVFTRHRSMGTHEGGWSQKRTARPSAPRANVRLFVHGVEAIQHLRSGDQKSSLPCLLIKFDNVVLDLSAPVP